MSTVWFMVDDTDPRLNYSGLWSFVPDTSNVTDYDGGPNFTGPVYNNTLHSTTDNATISFRFNGSSFLGVYGTQDGAVENGQLPDISCAVDGEQTWTFGDQYPTGTSPNNMLACRADATFGASSPGEHELLINVTNFPNSVWYFDYITFESLADPVFDGEILQAGNGELIDSSNYSMLTFGAGWTDTTEDSTSTSILNSEARIKFNGTSVTLYGTISSNVSNTAAYQVDEQDPVVFQLPGDPGIGLDIGPDSTPLTAVSKEPLFSAASLGIGEHTVLVAFNGSPSGMPLDINYFYVTSLTAAEQASLASPSSPASTSLSPASLPSSHPSSSPPSSNTGHTKVIIGAFLGSVIPIILLMVLATIVWVRKNNMRKRLFAAEVLEAPFSIKDATPPMPPSFKRQIIEDHVPTSPNDLDSIPGSANVRTMKLEQRLVILQEQAAAQQREAQMSTEPIIHTDSGMRLTEREEFPPGYTAD
ncbi:hypothetical protein BT96DRAFT_921287 [Gymnopus androsaceus JB14]|uniref:Uncharacterized protein n=1 Tax=Gymnopus androsaceus JB14 TaxID=1447944 RepID=A0A6A4HGJ3_9AGAR|nr:hypothetical protein BT96DRAFT_921287 [Gymnopus androsaceus JB14]